MESVKLLTANCFFRLNDAGRRDAILKGLKEVPTSLKIEVPEHLLKYAEVTDKLEINFYLTFDKLDSGGIVRSGFAFVPTVDDLVLEITKVAEKIEAEREKKAALEASKKAEETESFEALCKLINTENFVVSGSLGVLFCFVNNEKYDLIKTDERYEAVVKKLEIKLNEQREFAKKALEAKEEADKKAKEEADKKFKDWGRTHGSEHLKLLIEEGFEWKERAKKEFRLANLPEGFTIGFMPEKDVSEEDRTKPTLEELADLKFWREIVKTSDLYTEVFLCWNIFDDFGIASLDLTLKLPNGRTTRLFKYYEATREDN